MDVIYGLIPLMIVLGLAMVVIFFWTVRSGQYEDLDGDSQRMLMDDDDPMLPGKGTGEPRKQRGLNFPDDERED